MSNEQTDRDAPEPALPRAQWTLVPVWSKSGALGPDVVLGALPVVLGRTVTDPNGRAFPDSRMSRTHATIVVGASGPTVRDSSTNGTFVDGARIDGSALLSDGAVLRTGDTFFVVRAAATDPGDADLPELVGRAPAMARLRSSIALVAATDASVLVLGETGTGKELVARAIHQRSGRRGALVAVNCAAVPESLAESHLFGHVAGSFTGARSAHDGVFRRAHGGTLFLDEVAEASPGLQARLLRVLEERAVLPVGADRPVPVDVRLVTATHVALRGAVARGSFRADLYARISDLTIPVPPLRERREDIVPLLVRALGEGTPPPSPALIEALLLHDWPFNVRELLKTAREMTIRGSGLEVLDRALIAERLAPPSCPPPTCASTPSSAPPSAEPITRERLEQLMAEVGGNVSELARRLGRSRRQVRRYLETFELRADDS